MLYRPTYRSTNYVNKDTVKQQIKVLSCKSKSLAFKCQSTSIMNTNITNVVFICFPSIYNFM